MKEVPQIVPATGLSQDYKNALCAIMTYVKMDRVDKAVALIRKYGIPKYEEHFDPAEYGDVVNDQNRDGVRTLNRIVETVRTFTDLDTFPISDFERMMEEFDTTIYADTPHS